MKKTFLLAIIIAISNLFTLKAQDSSDIDIICVFDQLGIYEVEEYNLNTGEYLPFRITDHLPNCTIDIIASRSKKVLDIAFWHNSELLEMKRVTKVQRFADTGNTIFFECCLDDSTMLSIQCQVYERMAFIDSYKLDVVSLKYNCDWNLLKKICNVWY